MNLPSLLLPATLLLLTGPQEVGTTHRALSADEARADVLHLSDLLRRVHPDPYSGFGGRVEYDRRMQVLLDGIGTGPMAVPELRRRIAGFLGDLGDGHTGIGVISPESASGGPARYLPVRFRASQDGVFISDAVPDHSLLSGAKVLFVEGQAAEALARETRIFYPQENISGSFRNLARALGSRGSVREILPGVDDSLRLVLQMTPGIDGTPVRLAYDLDRGEHAAAPWPKAERPRIAGGTGPFHSDILEEGQIGYFRIGAMWSREAFESMRAAGRTDIGQWLEHAYESQLGVEVPDDQDAAIAGFPSIIEEGLTLLSEMRAYGTRRLIVDLRRNGGGFSIVGEPLLYLLRGDAYLNDPDPVFFATRVSSEYLEINGTSLEALSEETGRSIRLGDYLYDPPLGTLAQPISRISFFEHLKEEGFTGVDLLDSAEPTNSLDLVVLADGGTFSAAFDLAYHLKRLGGLLLGVSPSQSPTGFTDSTPYELPNSGLAGSMSRTAVRYPGVEAEDGAIVMDFPMTWERYREYDFHPDAEILYAVEILRSRRHPHSPGTPNRGHGVPHEPPGVTPADGLRPAPCRLPGLPESPG
jgi:hypothetical protein